MLRLFHRIKKLEEKLNPAPPRIIAAVAWQGRASAILHSDGRVEDGDWSQDHLPQSCTVYETPPGEVSLLFLGQDGRPGRTHVGAIDLDIVLGPKPGLSTEAALRLNRSSVPMESPTTWPQALIPYAMVWMAPGGPSVVYSPLLSR